MSKRFVQTSQPVTNSQNRTMASRFSLNCTQPCLSALSLSNKSSVLIVWTFDWCGNTCTNLKNETYWKYVWIECIITVWKKVFFSQKMQN